MPVDTGAKNPHPLLTRISDALNKDIDGQARLDLLTTIIADSLETDVCSIYLLRDSDTLELCATRGLKSQAVHKTRLRTSQGLVGRVIQQAAPLNTADAPNEPGFRYMPETGEEDYRSFLGIPIQHRGYSRGVLVVQSKFQRKFSDEDVENLKFVASVVAEMAELGAFVGKEKALAPPHTLPIQFHGTCAQEGVASGNVHLHEGRVIVSNLVAENPEAERKRLRQAMSKLKGGVDELLLSPIIDNVDGESREVIQAYRMFANSRGWLSRLEANIDRGLSAAAAVEMEQSEVRTRMARSTDKYLRDRLDDIDAISNKLVRILVGQESASHELPENPILVAKNIGPVELLEYGRSLRGVVLEEGSVGSHATIIARSLAIPLVVNVSEISAEALDGDRIIVDGDTGIVNLRPDAPVAQAYYDKMAMLEKEQNKYRQLRNFPATSKDGVTISLHMNAGLLPHLPSLEISGAEGVGLFRTELQFLAANTVPKRERLAKHYSNVLDAAKGKRVAFRTLDIGSDKILPYMKRHEEPNPALGWRAIRLALSRKGTLKMQLQAMIRGAANRNLSIMFPLVAEFDEFREAKSIFFEVLERERQYDHELPASVEIGAMLETPSLAFAPDQFFKEADFISIGGNDLKQFFFAADRENERVRRLYDALNVSFLSLIEKIVERCRSANTPLSFCGEDAGLPISAVCLAAMGVRTLSMRPASIGRVKNLIRKADLAAVRSTIDSERAKGASSVRPRIERLLEDC
ncbi:MAG: phosphoenolpyruvate--protein phosphotransferase [Albidovulum sp.]|nr:phosphoenolpyruvate--protein phosphotransferase [Albidovulum sp.]